MKTALYSPGGVAPLIDRYLNSVWYPVTLGALCAFSGLGDSGRYTVCMGLIAVSVLLTVLFSSDNKPLFAPMLMSFCALGKDSAESYGDHVGDVMGFYDTGAFAFVIGLGVVAVAALLLRFQRDGTLADIWNNRGRCAWGILAMDGAFMLNGAFSTHWQPVNLAYGALMAFGFTFFYFTCASIARRSENVARFACQCMVCTALLGIVQVAVVLQTGGVLSVHMGILSGEERNVIELGWGIATSVPAYLVLGIPAAFYLAANHRFSWLSYLLAFGIFGCILLMGSRGPILAALVALLIGAAACCFGKNKTLCRCYGLAVALCLTAGLLVLHFCFRPLSQWGRWILEVTRLDALQEDGRLLLWKTGWEDFFSSPVFGVGFDKGAFQEDLLVRNVFGNMYHNIGVQFGAAMGLTGLCAGGLHLYQVGGLLRRPGSGTLLILTLPLMILLMSMVDNYFFYLNHQIAYCMFLAVAERKAL